MKLPTIKECVIGQVTFEFYRSGELWYVCDNGFKFPVPIDDTQNATFLAKDKAILFMRYIRKYLIKCQSEMKSSSGGNYEL
jgi:hypothetical protein